MHVPEQIEPRGLADYLETMSKSVFQTGISWRVVDSKWPEIREAMRDFDPDTIARFGDMELEELANDKRVIRNRRKLKAIVDNARQMIDLEAKHGSFRNYLRSHDDFDSTDVVVVVGANDVVNPAARENPGSPIYGMPILNVDSAAHVVVLKRSLNPGFAGIDNDLFYKENTSMLFGDARDSITKLISEIKAL